jgi:hypothetical protein
VNMRVTASTAIAPHIFSRRAAPAQLRRPRARS